MVLLSAVGLACRRFARGRPEGSPRRWLGLIVVLILALSLHCLMEPH